MSLMNTKAEYLRGLITYRELVDEQIRMVITRMDAFVEHSDGVPFPCDIELEYCNTVIVAKGEVIDQSHYDRLQLVIEATTYK